MAVSSPFKKWYVATIKLQILKKSQIRITLIIPNATIAVGDSVISVSDNII